MDERNFDHLTAKLSSGTGRRGAIAGLVAGTAAAFGISKNTTTAKKKKKCQGCPQRACCSCTSDFQTATKCSLIEAESNADIQKACLAFCDPDQLFALNFTIPDRANLCAADNRCSVETCPVSLKR